MPLIYTRMLGEEGLNEQGFQLQYLVPSEQYIMLGVEVFKGQNEQSFGYEGFEISKDSHFVIEDTNYPSLWVAYAKTSFEMGQGTVLTGVSMAEGNSRLNHLDDENAQAYEGKNTLYGLDFTYKYYFTANHAITWQNEYLYREMDGTQYTQNASGQWQGLSLEKAEAGYYTELIYQYDKNWRTGFRYSAINQNEVTVNGNDKSNPEDSYVASAMLEYNPTEFSRLRLQYNHNSSLYDEEGNKNNNNEIILQFNYAIGAHGAHAF